MTWTVVDAETTGFDDDDQAVEIALACEGGRTEQSLVRPTCPIKFEAMATHNITEEMVADADPLEAVLPRLTLLKPFLVAHNARFDQRFLPGHTIDVCTYKCAVTVWPDAQSHKNMSLRYELGLDVSDMPEAAGGGAHRGLYDAWVTRALMFRLLQERSLDQLLAISRSPLLLPTFRFGKHTGEPIEAVPTGYLKWMRGQDFDEDVKHTVDVHLARRGVK